MNNEMKSVLVVFFFQWELIFSADGQETALGLKGLKSLISLYWYNSGRSQECKLAEHCFEYELRYVLLNTGIWNLQYSEQSWAAAAAAGGRVVFAIRCVSSLAGIISTQKTGGSPSPATHYRQSGAKDLPAHRPFRTSAGFPLLEGTAWTGAEVKKRSAVYIDGELPAARKPSRGVLQFTFIHVGAWLLMQKWKNSPSLPGTSFDFAGETECNWSSVMQRRWRETLIQMSK